MSSHTSSFDTYLIPLKPATKLVQELVGRNCIPAFKRDGIL